MSKPIGLYFGSFNPVHHGHLMIANYFYNLHLFSKIEFVVSPQNPLKQSVDLLPFEKRREWLQNAIRNKPFFSVNDIEEKLPKPSYTIQTLRFLQQQNPSQKFEIIMGADSLENIVKWKEYATILEQYKLHIFQRKNHEIASEFKNHSTIVVYDSPLIEISATQIRKWSRENRMVDFFVPELVAKELFSFL